MRRLATIAALALLGTCCLASSGCWSCDPACQQGSTRACTCADGREGVSECGLSGWWGSCNCDHCESDFDCEPGQWCVRENCEALPCQTDQDCPPSSICIEGKCVRVECVLDRDCSSGSKCLANTCVEICDTDEDCTAVRDGPSTCYLPFLSCFGGEVCWRDEDCQEPVVGQDWVTCSDLKGLCVAEIPTCTRDTLLQDCPAGMVCQQGMCAPKPPQCNNDDDCLAWEQCDLATAVCEGDTPDAGADADADTDAEAESSEPGTRPCSHDPDCPQGQVCTIDLEADRGLCIEPLCDQSQPSCAGPGEDCAAAEACVTGLCLGAEVGGELDGTCYGTCETDEDCPGELICSILICIDVCERPFVCVAERSPCQYDGDCAARGQVCGIEMSLTPTCIDPLCERGTEGCSTSGEECTDELVTCYNQACLGNWDLGYHCHQLCREGHDEDCEVSGQVCVGVNTVEGELHLCVTPGTPCQRDEDCDAGSGEVCGIAITMDPECRPELDDAVFSGDECDGTASPCYNGLCLGRDGSHGFQGTCHELCDPAREDQDPTCPAGQVCGQLDIGIGGDPVVLDVCVSPDAEAEADADAGMGDEG